MSESESFGRELFKALMPLTVILVIGAIALLLIVPVTNHVFYALQGTTPPEPGDLGEVLEFPDGWQPVLVREYRFVCEKDGVYRYCYPSVINPDGE